MISEMAGDTALQRSPSDGWKIPDILLSGNHAVIERWRRGQAIERTKQRRPDLLPPDGG